MTLVLSLSLHQFERALDEISEKIIEISKYVNRSLEGAGKVIVSIKGKCDSVRWKQIQLINVKKW